jgi:hypothetical protein
MTSPCGKLRIPINESGRAGCAICSRTETLVVVACFEHALLFLGGVPAHILLRYPNEAASSQRWRFERAENVALSEPSDIEKTPLAIALG